MSNKLVLPSLRQPVDPIREALDYLGRYGVGIDHFRGEFTARIYHKGNSISIVGDTPSNAIINLYNAAKKLGGP